MLLPLEDPREVVNEDPYENITSDGEEEAEIQLRLEELEAQKRDLIERLKRKKESSTKCDPNFGDVQVPSSPGKLGPLTTNGHRPMDLDEGVNIETTALPKRNRNELELAARLEKEQTSSSNNIPGNTTPYFMERFRNSKKREEAKFEQHQRLMSARVHTFGGMADTSDQVSISCDDLETYSGLWICRRYISQEQLDKTLYEIKILRLPKLFSKVRPPKFTEPQYSNWAVVGIISKKTDIKYTSTSPPKKYFKFTLTNFKLQIDVFVFGKEAVERYYNLRIGDIIALLNPEILPWRPSGKLNAIQSFNLRISHDYKCILEIGKSRDLGWCPEIIHSQNKPCGTPINKSVEKVCEYHREIQMRKTTSKRIELNSGYALGAPAKTSLQPTLYSSREHASGKSHISATENLVSEQERFSMLPSWSEQHSQFGGRFAKKSGYFTNENAAKAFFDEDFQNPDMLRNLESKRRKLADQNKERKLARELSRYSKGVNDGKTVTYDMSVKQLKEMRRTTQTALQSGFLQKLGFDPTHGNMAAVMNFNGNGFLREDKKDDAKSTVKEDDDKRWNKKETIVNDLISFRKSNVNLKTSKQEILRKRAKREQAWRRIFGKDGEHGQPIRNGEHSSDSELEIV